jgi:hypothetical protein
MRRRKKNNEIWKVSAALILFAIIAVTLMSIKDSYVSENDNIVTKFLQKPDTPIDPMVMKVIALTEQKEVTEAEIEQIRLNYIETTKELEQYKDNAKIPYQKITLDYTKLPDIPQYISNLIIREWVRHGGEDPIVPLAICAYESKFDPLTRNTNGENSWGLFQVNVGHPAHAKRMNYTDYARLYEPLFNMRYQFPELVAYERKGIHQGLIGSELAKYVAKYGQRPLWKDWIAQAIDGKYAEFDRAVIK